MTGEGARWLARARWGPWAEDLVDVELRGGRITRVAPAGTAPVREVRAGDDLAGARLVAGIHDHHAHLVAMAAADASVVCGAAMTRDDWREAIRTALPGPDGWIRVTGVHESFAGDLDRRGLDALRADVPIRAQHRTGMLWVLNTPAVDALGPLDHAGVERDPGGRPTGRLWRADAWLRQRVPARPPDLTRIGRMLLAHGITAITDATPELDPASAALLEHAAVSGTLPQRLTLLGAADGWTPSSPRVRVGARKIVLDEGELPDVDVLADRIARIHEAGRAVAVHCVTAASAYMLDLAFERAGVRAGDRVEHGAVLPGILIDRLAAWGVTVVAQPGFLGERGDAYLRDLDPGDLERLCALRDLHDAGVDIRFSSDAPYGPVDPARWLRDAVERRSPAGEVVGAAQRLTAEEAVAVLGLEPRIGGPADLLVVDPELIRDVLAFGRPLRPRRALIDGLGVWDEKP